MRGQIEIRKTQKTGILNFFEFYNVQFDGEKR